MRMPQSAGMFLAIMLWLLPLPGACWRSSLYPDNWYPGYADSASRYLHDFSYAGYHGGETAIPVSPPGVIFTVTESPYNADPTGSSDATPAIQKAITDAGIAGAGIVYMPEGTYRISPTLTIASGNIVLRGDGPDRTFLYCPDTAMRQKTLISVDPAGSVYWDENESFVSLLTRDISEPVQTLFVQDASHYAPGDLIVVRTSMTPEFIAEHGMTGKWDSTMTGIMLLRTVNGVDYGENAITIDTPTRYWMKVRDRARMYKAGAHCSEVGLENFSIGMRQNSKTTFGDLDYSIAGTGAFDVHGSHAVIFKNVINGWIRNVATYKPAGNAGDYHVLSNCLELMMCRYVTVDSCVFQKPQYEGEGGNGYLFIMRSNETLVKNCQGIHGRHNFDFKSMWTSGNVIMDCLGSQGRLASDFHMHLSPVNLFDNFTADREFLEARYRPYGTAPKLHGHTTSQTVFWNTNGAVCASGKAYCVQSSQFGWGYVIGTRGACPGINLTVDSGTLPQDFSEGTGMADSLEPVSLYRDQLARRLSGGPAALASSAHSDNECIIETSPNPFTFQIAIRVRPPDVRRFVGPLAVSIYSVNGACVFSSTVGCSSTASKRHGDVLLWESAGQPSGVYLIKARIGERTLTKAITLVK